MKEQVELPDYKGSVKLDVFKIRQFYVDKKTIKKMKHAPIVKMILSICPDILKNVKASKKVVCKDKKELVINHSNGGAKIYASLQTLYDYLVRSNTNDEEFLCKIIMEMIRYEIEIKRKKAPVRKWIFNNMTNEQTVLVCYAIHNLFKDSKSEKYNKTLQMGKETLTVHLPKDYISMTFNTYYKINVYPQSESGFVVEADDESLYYYFNPKVIEMLPGPIQ